MTSAEKFAKAKELRDQADALTREAIEDRRREQEERPLVERLVFSALARCTCDEGLAYDPSTAARGEGLGDWTCSAVLLGTAKPDDEHRPPMARGVFDVKAENSPSAGGATTRGPGQEKPPTKEGDGTKGDEPGPSKEIPRV